MCVGGGKRRELFDFLRQAYIFLPNSLSLLRTPEKKQPINVQGEKEAEKKKPFLHNGKVGASRRRGAETFKSCGFVYGGNRFLSGWSNLTLARFFLQRKLT